MNLSGMQQYIDEINARYPDSCFKLADAEHFYQCYGISTKEQLELHLNQGTYSDLYKEVYGVRPRNGFMMWSNEKLSEQIDCLCHMEAM